MIVYSVRETNSGYFVDADEGNGVVQTVLVTLRPSPTCSCPSFKLLNNPHNHFHIKVVRKWIKDGKSPYSRYTKGQSSSVETIL